MFPPGKIFYSWNERIRYTGDKGISIRRLRECLIFKFTTIERVFIDSEGNPCYLKIWGNNGKFCANILRPKSSHGIWDCNSIVELFSEFLKEYEFYVVI